MEDNLDSIVKVKTVTRSISLPVAECLTHSWRDFCKLLHQCWGQSTCLANWATHELVKADQPRTPGMKKMPPMPAVDLYALAFGRARVKKARKEGKDDLPVVQAQYDGGEFWAGAKIAAATLLRKVARKYGKERLAVIWRRERRSPEYAYPYPFPVHKQAWEAVSSEKGQPCVIMSLPGTRVTVRLRQGAEMAYHLRLFDQLLSGEVTGGELIICRQRAYASHRRQDSDRLAGGGHRRSWRIMLRMAVQVPVVSEKGNGVTAEVKTGRDPFVTVQLPGAEPWVLHAPWVQHWVMCHRKFLDQFADDLKYEKRWPDNKRRGLNNYQERRCEKHRRRMKTFVEQTAAQVVGFCARRGTNRVEWNDVDRSFVSEFPWFALRDQMQRKCDEAGLVFAPVASDDVPDDDEEADTNGNGDGA